MPAALGIQEWNGVKLIPYSLRRGNAKDAHPWIVDVESKVIRGEACLRVALGLKEKGYVPDIILAHPGWGESLFLKEVWPNAKLKLYCEFFYHARQADVDFDPEFSSKDPANAGRVALKNANLLLQFHNAESGLSPTFWQASTFPEYIRGKISIVHDGIDTDLLKPNPAAELTLPCGKVLTNQDEVVTYVARGLEPYRGFHIFMRALPELLKARPAAEVVIIGGEGVSYGAEHPSVRSWKVLLCDEVMPLLTVQQRARIHFMGRLNYSQFQAMLQVSRVHVYLTYPFVLSWSLLEA
ncbi:MAG: glycosyl transferase, partial [Proteobacteria bacterium]|nr:glycosyl transferase [Pseudomonadota bacterium]